jgi:hypothetical protein
MPRFFPTALVLCLASAFAAHAESSALWGKHGERWDPAGRLPDFSRAGYHSGERAIPSPPPGANVRQFGARGDGATDDTDAFERAIAATPRGVLHVPAGRYRITRVLRFRQPHFILRGDGPGRTTLFFPKGLLEVLGPRPGTGETGNWSWAGGFLWVEGREASRRDGSITQPARRGSRDLVVAEPHSLRPGDRVRLVMTDRAGSLGRHLHADRLDMHPSLVGRPLVRFPARVAAVRGPRVTLDRPLRTDVRPEWRPELRTITGATEEIGLEGFTLEFPERPYAGHYRETGANGIWMDNVWNSWVRDVEVRNSDCAILLERTTFCTVDGVRLTADRGRGRFAKKGLHTGWHTGHHGIQLRAGDDGLVRRFRIETRFHHDLTVENTTGSVFSEGSGVDLCFDHHTHLPYENLFTEIDLGAGTRPWLSNGSADPESGARETFWNLRSARPITSVATRKGVWPEMNLIGIPTTLPPSPPRSDTWIEPIPPHALQPKNLYHAQVARRRANPDPPIHRSQR